MGTPELTQLMDSNESWLSPEREHPPHLMAAKRCWCTCNAYVRWAFSVPRAHQSQHYRSQVRRLAHRIFRYNGAKISVKRELHFLPFMSRPCIYGWNFAPSKYLEFIGKCKLRPDMPVHEWEWQNFMAANRDEIDFSCSADAVKWTRATRLRIHIQHTQEIWRFYVSPDNTRTLQFNAIYFLWGKRTRSTRHSPRRMRAMDGKNSDSRHEGSLTLQSNAHPIQYILKLCARIPRIIYSISNKRQTRREISLFISRKSAAISISVEICKFRWKLKASHSLRAIFEF